MSETREFDVTCPVLQFISSLAGTQDTGLLTGPTGSPTIPFPYNQTIRQKWQIDSFHFPLLIAGQGSAAAPTEVTYSLQLLEDNAKIIWSLTDQKPLSLVSGTLAELNTTLDADLVNPITLTLGRFLSFRCFLNVDKPCVASSLQMALGSNSLGQGNIHIIENF